MRTAQASFAPQARDAKKPRTTWRTWALLIAAALAGVVAAGGGGPAWGAFTSSTSVGSNSFTAASSFPTYPTEVLGDSPSAYYREDDTTGYDTATDAVSSGPRGGYGQVSSPTTIWSFDEGSGTTTADLADGGTGADPGTLEGTTSWVAGQEGDAVSLDGSTGYVQGAATSVATNYSFSVGAWAYLTDTGYTTDTNILLSQDDSVTSPAVSAFELGCVSGKWTFSMPASDSTSASVSSVTGDTCSLNTWVYLSATYQATSGSTAPVMTLYENGSQVASGGGRAVGSEWASTGPLIAGAGLSTTRTGYWHGEIDEVTTYGYNTNAGTAARVLTAAEEAALYSQSFGGPVLRYGFDEGSGTSTEDLSGHLDTGTFSGSVTWGSGHTGNSTDYAMSVASGQTGYAQSADTAVVDTSKSFSVSAWVYLTDGTTTRTAVSEVGTTSSGFYLKYDDNPTPAVWGFMLTESDTTNPTVDEAVSTSSAALNTWVFLTGVYDATAQKAYLYVNGVLQNSVAHPVSWDSTGYTEIGRSLWNSTWVDQWAGSIDSVQIFQRALSASEITHMYSGYNSGTISAGVSGALQGAQQGQQSSTAVAFNGLGNGYDPVPITNPNPFTEECWFRANGTLGGDLMGFASGPIGTSSSSYDRVVYLDSGGHVTFGVYPGPGETLASPGTYNDGNWHYVAATLGPAGMDLYIDGVLVASNTSYTSAQNVSGYWHWGGADLANWPNAPADYDLSGQLDEIAFYNSQLSAQQVAWHYNANH